MKTRKTDWWGNPEEAVSASKIKNIIKAADFYLKEYDIETPVRFDIVAIVYNPEKTKIRHIEDAFYAAP